MSHTRATNRKRTESLLGADLSLTGGPTAVTDVVTVSITPRRKQRVLVVVTYEYQQTAGGSWSITYIANKTSGARLLANAEAAGTSWGWRGASLVASSEVLTPGTTYTFALQIQNTDATAAHTVKATQTKIAVLWDES